jgi:hypothetical protein
MSWADLRWLVSPPARQNGIESLPWTGAWLRNLGLGKYEPAFIENAIDFDVLPELTEDDLEKLGLPLGDRKRFTRAIKALAGGSSSGPSKSEVEQAHDEGLDQVTAPDNGINRSPGSKLHICGRTSRHFPFVNALKYKAKNSEPNFFGWDLRPFRCRAR